MKGEREVENLRFIMQRLADLEAQVRDLKTHESYGDDVIIPGLFRLEYAGELTIAGGVVTKAGAWHSVDTEGGAGTDDLDTINGGTAGDELTLMAEDSARTIVCKNATGNMQLAGGADFSLDHTDDRIKLQFDGANWVELTRSDNS